MKFDNGVVWKWRLRWAVTPAEFALLQELTSFGSRFGGVGSDSDGVLMDCQYSLVVG
jgi:hypothetical protein